jgi:hypothetical protein
LAVLGAAACGDDSGSDDSGNDKGDAGGQTNDASSNGGDAAVTGQQDAQASDAGTQNQNDSGPPTPHGKWDNVTGNLANMPVGCGNLLLIAANPASDLVFAGLPMTELWSFDHAATSWSSMDTGAGADPLNGGPQSARFDPKDPKHFWVTTIYGDHGVYETKDNGQTFHAAGDARHIDEVAVNYGASDFLPWVAGGHETGQTLWLSTDGKAWTTIGTGLPAEKSCTHPLVLDSKTFLVGCSYNAEGIYRSTDSGQTWKLVSEKGGTATGIQHPNGTLIWAGGGGALFVSTDQGLTWKQSGAAGKLAGINLGPVLLPDGRIAVVGSDGIMVSKDLGVTWTTVSTALPYGDITGFTYSPGQHAFFIKHNTCMDPVPTDAVMRYEWDYLAN